MVGERPWWFGIVWLCVGCANTSPPSVSSVLKASARPAIVILGQAPGVSMARLSFEAGQAQTLAAGRCQDVLLFVQSGAIAVSPADHWVRQGEAMRLGQSTTIRSAPEGDTEVFAVAAISLRAGSMPASFTEAPRDEACAESSSADVIRSDPSRSGPFLHAGGKLKVMLYVDASNQGARYASLGTLDADPMLGVPEHLHEQSAEVLWVRDGSGTMRLGDQTLRIEPGTFVYVPPQTIHGFVPDGRRPLFAFQVYTPAGPEQRFREGLAPPPQP